MSDQLQADKPAPGFAQVNPAPNDVKSYPGNQGSVDPKTDGGGSGGNDLGVLHRKIIGK